MRISLGAQRGGWRKKKAARVVKKETHVPGGGLVPVPRNKKPIMAKKKALTRSTKATRMKIVPKKRRAPQINGPQTGL